MVLLLVAGPVVYVRLFPPQQRTLDYLLAIFGCVTAAALVAAVTAVWVGMLARRTGRRYPPAGLLPLGLVAGVVALAVGYVAYQKAQADDPRPLSAPTAPLPRPAPQ